MYGRTRIFQLLRVRSAVTLQGPTHRLTPARERFLHAAAMPSRNKLGLNSYALLVIPGTAFCLGCWQLQRQQWKLSLIKELQDKMSQPPIPLPDDESAMEEMEYQSVMFSGTFDHSKEVLMGPRPPLRNGRYAETGSMVSSGSTGFLVVTPFTLEGSGKTILVNRGWVHKKLKDPSTREDGQITGVLQLTGVVRLQEKRGPFMPRNQSRDKFFLYRDVESMAAVTGAAPVFLDLCEGTPGGPLAGQTRITLRNEHLSYVLTWFTLSFATGYMWYQRYGKLRAIW